MTQTVPSKSTANVTYQGTARSRVPQAVLLRSTDGHYYPRMDNRRPRISSYSPSSRSYTTRTPPRPHKPKIIVISVWVESTVGSQAVLPQTVKKSAMISPKQTWKPKGNYLDSVNRGNGSYTLKQFEYGNPEEDLKDYAIIDSGCSGSMTGDKDKLSDFKEFKGFDLARFNFLVKGIKREYSIARTPQQNGVAERKNRTLIEAARTMLADSLLPIQFWAEAVNTAFRMKISVGITTNSKGFRVYNRVTRKVQDCLHVNFLENQENQKGKGPDWMFDLDLLTPSMNYIPVRKENYADSKEQGISCDDVEDMDDQQFIIHTAQPMPPEERTAAKEVKLSSEDQALHDELRRISIAKGKEHVDSTFTLSTANTPPQSTGNTPTDSVFHSKTKHIQIRHHFIRDCYEQRLINVVKVHTDDNVADLLTKGFDLARFNFLVVAGKKILISEATIRADLLFDDENGVDCFPKQVIWDTLRDIGYEGNLAQLTFSKPLFSPQWKYLVHVLLHCLSPKSTSWEQFGTNIASALVEGVDRPQDFIPSVSLPSKVFTFMRKHSTKFSCRITPLTPMLEVVTALAAEEAHSTSPHSRDARDAQGTPDQSAAQASVSQRTAEVQGTDTSQRTAEVQGTAHSQGTADFQGMAEPHGAASIPKSPNDYTPTDASQTSGGDEGLLDLYALNREVRRLKKQTLSQAKLIRKLKAKLKNLSKVVAPVVKHHAFWVESQHLKKQKRRRKKQKKKVSSVKLGRNKEEGTLSEEHYVQDDYTADPFFEDIVDKDAAVTPDIERKSDETEALERKSDETEEINVEEKEASNVKSGDTEELDLETFQSTARQSTITPRTLNFEDEAGPSSPIRPTQNIEPEEQFKVDEVLADISRPRGLSIPGPIQSQPQPQQPSQATDPKDKGKGILVEEPKKKKLTLQQIRALETTNDEEVARKIQAEWDAEEERKRFEELKKAKPKTTLRKPTTLAQERNQMMNFLKGQGYKNLQKLKYPQMKELYDKVQESIKDSFKDFIPMDSEREKQILKERDEKRLLRKRKATISEEQPSKKLKLRTETIDELRNYLRIVDFEKNAQDRESLEGISMITELQVIDSPDGEYLIIHRANNHFRAFDTLWEILHILDRQDLYHLYRVVDDYYEHIPPTGLGLALLVHTLEIEDGTMIHMLAERRYPLSRELMIRMLDHGMEVEEETETAITLIHLFILWTTEDGDNS
ncbi:ribonuclease H-like domain-containing protein [Tanacetum coccineum]